MSGNTNCTVYIGNLDERVSDRVLYDILIQAGRVLDLHIPKDRETDRPKGYAFAQYETQEIADYAVKLFSGLVSLYNRTLKFGISGQDKVSQSLPATQIPASNRPRPQLVPINNMEISHHSMRSLAPCRVSASPANHSQVPLTPGVMNQPNDYGSHYNGNNHEYSRRVFGEAFDSNSRSRSRRYDTSNPISYPSY
ncbi:RRM_1 domain-containing protein [Cephalotus follicularis]|uniref:RRM_1 domain-containing protein n=1 Tax=Cephalotus follicularis TaxID=3775 RepID=A0A1Q3AXA7_CEPFO|nr:RRM_1 domain-containing protein [Cephalotus follicularis]